MQLLKENTLEVFQGSQGVQVIVTETLRIVPTITLSSDEKRNEMV